MNIIGLIIVAIVLLMAARLVIAIIRWLSKPSGRTLDRAWNEYQDALRDLENDPINRDLRKKALNKGRAFAALNEDYPESAIQNDIMARLD